MCPVPLGNTVPPSDEAIALQSHMLKIDVYKQEEQPWEVGFDISLGHVCICYPPTDF